MNPKIYGIFSILFFLSATIYAQPARSGIPWSKTQIVAEVSSAEIALPRPDFEAAAYEDIQPAATAGAYRIALPVETDISFQQDGIYTYLDDGRMIWRLSVVIPDAKALSVDIDDLYLPDGVRLYFSNENGKQLVGAFTNRDVSAQFGVPLVQGSKMNIEVNIPPGTSISDISLHIHKAYAAYRSGLVDGLEQYYGDTSSGGKLQRPLNDFSSPCQINAVCETDTFISKIKNTAVQIQLGAYLCSGNLINNSQNDCTPYLLTASHCEETNSMNNSTFSTWVFYFNYEYPNCGDNSQISVAPMSQFLTGAMFVARSFVPQTSPTPIVEDFLLLRLNDPLNFLENEWDAYLAGWSIEDSSAGDALPPDTLYNLVNYHHPVGDPKKINTADSMISGYNFNNGAEDTHWGVYFTAGGFEGGSSGSGIFTASDRYLRGILNGAALTDPCFPSEYYSTLFGKLSRCWDYPEGDGTAQTRLRDHLDPEGLGLTHAPTIKYQCTPVGISQSENDYSIYVFPNPASSVITVKANLPHTSDIEMAIYDISGKKCATYHVPGVKNSEISADVSMLPEGLYFIKIWSGNSTWSQKLLIRR